MSGMFPVPGEVKSGGRVIAASRLPTDGKVAESAQVVAKQGKTGVKSPNSGGIRELQRDCCCRFWRLGKIASTVRIFSFL
ncbi:MAG: hypothetical protein NXI04_00510 [Planctomycetaceae bacterium]|nr:hypothetical protein [Planctomycetaceae bacterium]